MGHRLRLKSGKIKAMVEKSNKMTKTRRRALRAQCLRTDCTGDPGTAAVRPHRNDKGKRRTCTTLKNHYYKKSKSSQVDKPKPMVRKHSSFL
uniref:Uncharacterized protein n=1 Tax=Mandrillus leucophaeus TaxID=9568 RepID=A0A2K5Y7W1_MANLE